MNTPPPVLHCSLFNGRQARPIPVRLSLIKGVLNITGEGLQLQVPEQQLRWPERQRHGTRIAYLPDGATLDLAFERPLEAIADAFDGDAVRAAILGAQQGRVMYPEFKRLSQRAGCIGYTVWIAGRHVTYLGRRGETHVERFPG